MKISDIFFPFVGRQVVWPLWALSSQGPANEKEGPGCNFCFIPFFHVNQLGCGLLTSAQEAQLCGLVSPSIPSDGPGLLLQDTPDKGQQRGLVLLADDLAGAGTPGVRPLPQPALPISHPNPGRHVASVAWHGPPLCLPVPSTTSPLPN